MQVQQQNLALSQQYADMQKQLYGQVQPFGAAALQSGQDALAGKVNPQFLLPIRNSLSASFGQSRQNLIDALGKSGQYGSGVSVGPQAALENDQSRAVGDATSQALQAQLGMGFQGANVLAGQQGLYNPITAGTSAVQDPTMYKRAFGFGDVLGALSGAALGGFGSTVGKSLGAKVPV